MKRKLILVVIMWLFFLLETAVLPMIPYLSAVPNLMLILTVAIGFIQGKKEGLLMGFFCGLLVDIGFGAVFGVNALLLVLIGYISGCFADIYFDEDVKIPLLLVTGGELLINLVTFVTGFLFRGRFDIGGYLLKVILPQTVCTMIFTLLLYRLLYQLNHALVEKEKKGRQSLWIRD